MTRLPKYDSPPVIETVLGAQFSPLPGFTTAHAGWFWKNGLDDAWPTVREAPTIQDVFERFGEDRQWGPESTLTLFTEPGSNRLQIIRSDNERMIQVQPSRFIYNWKKSGEGEYPSYEKLLPEFRDHFDRFNKFTSDAGYPDIEVNQWEVTYVNHIPKGELWADTAEWQNVIPRLEAFNTAIEGQKFDVFAGNWSLTLGGNKGRLHIVAKHIRVGSAKGPEALSLQLTARGPVDPKKGLSLQDGFDIGHKAIVLTFTELTSKRAQEVWRRSV